MVARLSGTAVRLARAGGPIDEAVTELRTLAGGRGDLLAETAGVMAGAWSVRIGTGDYLLAAGLLVTAGADHDRIAEWVAVGRQRATTPRHSI
jgi:5-hydroxyisourate hydrolase-like protein (transthyretin family)